jgi:hypothetical protein
VLLIAVVSPGSKLLFVDFALRCNLHFDCLPGRRRVDRNNLDQFYDYHYRRTRKPKVSLPENFASMQQH